jgi:hypothetical protein
MIETLVTLPSLTAWALAEHSIASRQPLPTPPGFENPIVYLAAVPPAPPDAAGDEVQAPVTTARAAIATNARAIPIFFM